MYLTFSFVMKYVYASYIGTGNNKRTEKKLNSNKNRFNVLAFTFTFTFTFTYNITISGQPNQMTIETIPHHKLR